MDIQAQKRQGFVLVRRCLEAFALLMVVLLTTAACSANPSSEGHTISSAPLTTNGASSGAVASEIFFPRQRANRGAPDAIGNGELILDDKGCLRVQDGDGSAAVPLWPASFDLSTSGREVRVLNSKGKVVGMVGERIIMGGGAVAKDTVKENGTVDRRTLSELLDRCPGVYFLAQEEGMHIHR